MSRSPYKLQIPPEDKVAVLWGGLHGPQTRFPEGAYAIKVSMSYLNEHAMFMYKCRASHGPLVCIWPLEVLLHFQHTGLPLFPPLVPL